MLLEKAKGLERKRAEENGPYLQLLQRPAAGSLPCAQQPPPTLREAGGGVVRGWGVKGSLAPGRAEGRGLEAVGGAW